MNSMCVRSGYCDDTAEALLAEAGGVGRVLTVSPGTVGGVVRTPELGRIEAWAYHKVYSDGRYVYDPLLSTDAVPLGDWRKLMRALNPGAVIR